MNILILDILQLKLFVGLLADDLGSKDSPPVSYQECRQMSSLQNAAIPYVAYWCSPFAKWQGALSHLHSVEFAATTARRALARRKIEPGVFDYSVLGMTVP